MAQLGNVRIYIPDGTKVYGVILVDKNQQAIAGTPITVTNSKHGDWLQVEFADPKLALAEDQETSKQGGVTMERSVFNEFETGQGNREAQVPLVRYRTEVTLPAPVCGLRSCRVLAPVGRVG